MNSVIKKKKTIEDEAQIFISTRFYSNDKNIKVSDRDSSPFVLPKKIDKKDGVTTCRKPIILKGNLPSVFDIDKLKIIKRRNVGSFYDKHRILLKTEITSTQINDLFTNQSNITQDYFDNKDIKFNDNEGIKKERSCETRKYSSKIKNKISPFQSKFLESKKSKDKTNSSQNINYFNCTNDRILISKNSEKFKSSFIEKSFSKSLLQQNNNNHSTSHKNSSILIESNIEKEKESETKKRNNKAIQIHKAEIETSMAKESISRRPSQIKIKNFKKYNLDSKAIKRIFTKTPPSLTELGLIKTTNNFDKLIKLEDVITLSILKTDSKSRLKKVFSVVNFEVLLVKEILMNSKINVINVKESLSQWKSKLRHSDHFVKIYHEYVNQPEGYFSILLEYLQGFSLQDLINSVGCINEDILKPIILKTIESLLDYNEKFNADYRDICPCDIVFDKKGNLKIIPFIIKTPFKVEIETQIRNEVKCKCQDYFHNKNFLGMNIANTHSTNDSQSQCGQSSNNFFKRSDDNKFPSINFNIGIIILICLLGSNKVQAMDSLNNINITELFKTKICCLYHYLNLYDETNNKNTKFKFITFVNETLISNDLSNLLCDLLSFDNKLKELKKIKAHPWFKSPRNNKTKIYLKELIKIVRDIKRTNILLKNETPLNNFINSLGIILINNKDIKNNNTFLCKLFEPIENVKSLVDQRRHHIKEISKELGTNSTILTEKINNLIMDIKTDKFFQK